MEPKRITRYIDIIWLPITLVVLLIIETFSFNNWFNVDPSLYIGRCLAASLGIGVVLFFPSIFFSKKVFRYVYLFLASGIVFLIFISQFLYYEYSGGFLQASSLSYANQSIDLIGTILTLLSIKILLFFIPLIVVVFGYFITDKKQARIKLFGREKIVASFLLLIIFCVSIGTLLGIEYREYGDISRLYNNDKMYDLSSLVGKIGVVNYYFESLVETAIEPKVATAQDKSFLTSFADARTLPAHGTDFGIYKGKNLIFIQVESLENWVIGYKLNGVEVAPNLTKLSEEGKYFTNYYSQDGMGNTADAEFSILNSLYPLPDSVAFITHAENKYAALPQLLDNNGYTTVVMHGDVSTFWNRSNMYPSLGYQKQISQEAYTIPRPIGFQNLGDDDFFKQTLPKLEALPQPFMATVITLSTHTPFILPSDLETLTFPKDTTLTPTQQQYLQAVHYSDNALGDFIAGLKADGLYDKSVIAIYGDHTAFIGTPDSQIQHVPLIILAPGTGTFMQGVDTIPASHLDLYPTVASLLGIQYPINVLGQDLFSTKTPVVTQRVIGTAAIKFIISLNLKYTGAPDSIFGDGTCVTVPAGLPLPVASCQNLYNQQLNNTQASDMVVRYNLLPLLQQKP